MQVRHFLLCCVDDACGWRARLVVAGRPEITVDDDHWKVKLWEHRDRTRAHWFAAVDAIVVDLDNPGRVGRVHLDKP